MGTSMLEKIPAEMTLESGSKIMFVVDNWYIHMLKQISQHVFFNIGVSSPLITLQMLYMISNAAHATVFVESIPMSLLKSQW